MSLSAWILLASLNLWALNSLVQLKSYTHLSRTQVDEYLHQWGTSVVESILDPSCQIFSIPEVEGLIGYYANRGSVIVFGDPVCCPNNREILTTAFHNYCETQKKNVIYLVASVGFAKWMQKEQEAALITFGKEFFLDPQSDPQSHAGKKGISLRGKIRHAKKNGLLVHEYLQDCPELENKIQETAHKWLKNRRGPQVYISKVRLFAERFGKRWFYAEQNGQLVGCIVLNKLGAKEGWVLDRLMTVPNAPQGTSEMLVISVMEALGKEGCKFLTFGAINGKKIGEISGFGKCTSFLVPHIYNASVKIFNLQKKAKYWEKFNPESTPTFLVFKKPRLGLYEADCLMRALNVSFSNKY